MNRIKVIVLRIYIYNKFERFATRHWTSYMQASYDNAIYYLIESYN